MANEVIVRVESCLLAEDGSHVLVNAALPDGTHVINASMLLPSTPEALAQALLAYTGPRYRQLGPFTGNIRVEKPTASAPAPVASPEPPVEAPVEVDAPTSVGVGDGAKGKSKS